MTSDKQLHANRANATKSTGPRSQAGKARSRLNSRKHGLTAKMLIIVGENADDFDQLRAELMAEHDPQSTLECELVERLAGILWRLRRVPFFEAAILDSRQGQASRARSLNNRFQGPGRLGPIGTCRPSVKPLSMMRALAMRLESSRATRQP